MDKLPTRLARAGTEPDPETGRGIATYSLVINLRKDCRRRTNGRIRVLQAG